MARTGALALSQLTQLGRLRGLLNSQLLAGSRRSSPSVLRAQATQMTPLNSEGPKTSTNARKKSGGEWEGRGQKGRGGTRERVAVRATGVHNAQRETVKRSLVSTVLTWRPGWEGQWSAARARSKAGHLGGRVWRSTSAGSRGTPHCAPSVAHGFHLPSGWRRPHRVSSCLAGWRMPVPLRTATGPPECPLRLSVHPRRRLRVSPSPPCHLET